MDDINNLPVNIFDIGVIAILLASALLAYVRGFVHEVLSIIGWGGAILATYYGFPYLQPHARQLIPMQLAADLTAGVVIFIFTLVFLSMMTRSVSKKVQNSALNALDRALGFLFGLARGALIVVIAYIGLELVMPKQPAFIQGARSMELIEPARKELRKLLPDRYGGAGEQYSSTPTTPSDPGKAVLDIISPTLKSTNTSDETRPGGYGKGQRQEMERLIGNTQQ